MVGEVDVLVLLVIAIALGVGGFVKGATGSGTPLVAVPIIATFYDVKMGILVMVVPNIVMNAKQLWIYRANIRPAYIAVLMSLGSMPGIIVGTLLLTKIPQDELLLGLGLFLLAYLTLRLFGLKLQIPERIALKASLPTGFVGGIMQGVVGSSGPLALMFLSAQNLVRPMFIGTISAFFLTNSVIQAPALWWKGLLTLEWIVISALSLIPVWLCLPLGNRAAQKLSLVSFNRWIMVLLAVLCVRLIWRGLT